ncbi:ubiquitin c-terminal hydrolase [Moniliophthora roreri MCA 2997]|uniref:ubiquitinyl hydrolase 1 n=2 Tax=Moniliophthora roreri TaxID=221103 RepID=V2WU11_MONRO|nr:ubiquitin c-terminal hydrolase [Moniliophthora roreri MCA 2997]KAI3607800.1 ubiquitin c-terminal hydrolase [Moniliophthora roreri]
MSDSDSSLDLIGGPFSVIESDPGVFTSLTRLLGIKNVELVEIYDIEPWAVDHLRPHGLIFCFHWRKDSHRSSDFDDPAAERVWFANQLSDDACASHAILNVALNCPGLDVGEELGMFREETKEMSPVIKGLAVSSSSLIRNAHNSLARPADRRGALNTLALTSLSAASKKEKEKNKQSQSQSKRQPKPKTKATTKKPKDTDDDENEGDNQEAYHFIGYVPAYGKVWELDGFKSGPLEVGELPTTTSSSDSDTTHWMDTVRPALRLKMQKYGGGSEEGSSNIRFSLLALVDGVYEQASDEYEFWRREKKSVERRLDELDEKWREKVDPTLIVASDDAFPNSNLPVPTYAKDFASRRMTNDILVLKMNQDELLAAWEQAIQSGMRAKVALEDELKKGRRDHTDHIKRTHDYEPFLTEFITCLHAQGLVDALVNKPKKPAAKGKANGKVNGKTTRKKAKIDRDEGEDGIWKP